MSPSAFKQQGAEPLSFPRFTVECSPLPFRAGGVTIARPRIFRETPLSEPFPETSPTGSPPQNRLDSWKEIAAYLKRDVTTVQRWEKREGMPVHRHVHDRIGSVYAFTLELNAWQQSRKLGLEEEEREQAAHAPVDGKGGENTRWTQGAPRWLVLAGGAVLVLLTLAYGLVRRHPGTATQPKIKSLAVLPLKNLSGDPTQEYLADGMTEALVGRLSSIHDLRVISRTSVMRFKDTKLSVPEIAKTLGVDALVEGSVMREGNHIRVHAQLIRAATDEHFWSEAYDREMRDALALESDVAQSIARKVEVTVTGEEHARLTAARSVSPEVYESYLKGRFALGKGNSRADIDEGIADFENAIKQDPTFALAYVGLANAHARLSSVFIGAPPTTERASAMSFAQKALELDSQVPEAHVLLANMEKEQWQWTESETEFKRALELNPHDAEAHDGLARWLLAHARTDEALAWARRGRELDPLAVSGTEIGWVLFQSHRYDEAMRELRSVMAVRPDDATALWFLGFVLVANNQPEEAIPVLQKAFSASDRSSAVIGVMVRAYAHAGRRKEALRLLAELKKRKQTGYVPAAAFVNAYLGLDDKEQAFTWLEDAYKEHSTILQWLKVHPYFDPLRDDPRFKDLLHRVGLD
jgi:TolB-like protein/tetratricopeptide (TPR) repeat protein